MSSSVGANTKAFTLARFTRLEFDAFNHSMHWPAVRPANQSVNTFGYSESVQLNASVTTIGDPTAQAEFKRFVLSGIAKSNALNATVDSGADRFNTDLIHSQLSNGLTRPTAKNSDT